MSGYQKDIAIVGLGCILPDAFSPQQFWENNINGHIALRPLHVHNRWNWEIFYDADSSKPDKTYTKTAGAICNYEFDWRKFRIPPSEVKTSSPMQFMILDAGAQALDNIKVLPKKRTGIYIGSIGSGWQKDTGLQIHRDAMMQALKASPCFSSLLDDIQGQIIESAAAEMDQSLNSAAVENMIVHSLASIACGRIAQYFDIKGPHVSVDSGYASSLAALEMGIRSLQEGSVDLSLVGGASEILTPLNMIAFSKLGGLAKSAIRPFDADATGTLLGEGTAMFALKRLEDAVRDEEHIYAVIKGIGCSSDGSGKSLLAPDYRGQSLAMKRAYEDAGVDPKTISYIECHATGTQVGDGSEIKALSSLHDSAASYKIALGSVKANIGHLGPAAGAAGLLRTVLTLYHRRIPPQIHFHTPNPYMELPLTPFVLPSQPAPLKPQEESILPRAAVSSFGFGGTNYHAVLEAYSPEHTALKASACSEFEDEPIAIIGMSGIFPDADNKETFWSNLLEGKNAIIEIPNERFDCGLFYDGSKAAPEKSYTKLGGFLSFKQHDSSKWKIPPASIPYVDESHQLALICAEQALQDAGYNPETWDREQISVILGFLPYQNKKFLADVRVNYQEIHQIFAKVLEEREYSIPPALQRHILDEAEQLFTANLPKVTEDTLAGYLGSLATGRIAKHFNFKGAQLTVDAACCSAHLAFWAGVQSLRHKKSDAVLVGGINADMSPEFYVGGCGIQALSADGIRPFDARADGFVPGEGAGFFVLRRLSDAKRDGQKIFALIRSVVCTSDGKSGSILAPSLEGESSSMIQALQQAGVSPEQVDYVECHGTGTAMGDAIEVEALMKAYGADRTKPLHIGSVKSNIGHLLAAAAVPAVMKTIYAMREGVIPPSINVGILNPKLESAGGAIQVVTSCEQWETEQDQPRRAGVSGFGLGGANSHMILEEYKPTKQQIRSVPFSHQSSKMDHILPIAATQGANLADCVRKMLQAAQEISKQPEEQYLLSISQMQQAINPEHPGLYRVGIVAKDSRELLRKAKLLTTAVSKGINTDFLRQQGVFIGKAEPHLRVGVVFPGQGVQYPNMLRAVMEHFSAAAEIMKRIDREYQSLCGKSLSGTFFTDSPEDFQQNDEDIHCAVFAVNYAVFMLLRTYGLEFDAAIGQSAGELAALVAVESLSLQDALKAVRERTLSVLSLQGKDPGKMMTVHCSAGEAKKHFREVKGYCEISADNSPRMCIVSGETPAIRELRGIYERNRIQAELLPVSHGYHSLMISEAREPYRRVLDTCTFYQPKCDMISTITGDNLRQIPVQDYPELLASQFIEPVRLRQAIETAHENGVRLFIECGPKWAISSFISEILGEKDFYAQASLHPKIGEAEQIHRALACMFVHGKGQLIPKNTHEERVGTEMKFGDKTTKETVSAGDLLQEISMMVPEKGGDTATLLFLKSLRDMIDAFLQSKMEAKAEGFAAHVSESPKQKEKLAESSQDVMNEKQPLHRDESSIREEVTEYLLSLMVQRTGYPKDMLEFDLDMEADLGIDTVKQVAVWGEARLHFGVEQEAGFKIRDHATLQKMVDYFVFKLGDMKQLQTSRNTVATTMEAKSPTFTMEDVQQVIMDLTVNRTGYPADMLELDLDLEADLGIDTVKQVAILAEARKHFRLEQEQGFRVRDYHTLRKIITYFHARLKGTAIEAKQSSFFE